MKLVTAKIIASLETITAMYVIFLLLNFILYMGIYGLQGWNVNIQSSLHYASSTYDLTFLQMFLISVALNILGLIAMTIITLFISAKLNAPVTALIASCVVCFLPVLFDFSESVPLLQKLQEVCPIFMLHMNGVFTSVKTCSILLSFSPYSGLLKSTGLTPLKLPAIILSIVLIRMDLLMPFLTITKKIFLNSQKNN